MSLRRWFARSFLTRTSPDPFCGWHVQRPDWWTLGETSGVTAPTRAEALAQLDEWQNDMWGRAKARRHAH